MVRLVTKGASSRRGTLAAKTSTRKWRRLRPVIYFDRGSSRLRRIYRNQLRLIAGRLRKASDARPLVLEGHANPQESEREALGLSRRRAEAVAGTLRSFGVSPERLMIVPNGSRERGRNAATARLPAWNRRVVILWPPHPRASAAAGVPGPAGRAVSDVAAAIYG